MLIQFIRRPFFYPQNRYVPLGSSSAPVRSSVCPHGAMRLSLDKLWWNFIFGKGQLKCDGTRAETRIRLTAKRTSSITSAGASVQSTTGSRVVRISDSNPGYTKFRGIVKGTGYPLHSPVPPSLSLPCVTVCHHISTRIYCKRQFFV